MPEGVVGVVADGPGPVEPRTDVVGVEACGVSPPESSASSASPAWPAWPDPFELPGRPLRSSAIVAVDAVDGDDAPPGRVEIVGVPGVAGTEGIDGTGTAASSDTTGAERGVELDVVDSSGTRPGFCHTDWAVGSPRPGNSAAFTAVAAANEPASAAITSPTVVPRPRGGVRRRGTRRGGSPSAEAVSTTGR